jgi:hypothetical protein
MAMESKRRTQSGILTRRQLRDSEDEQIILDLVASVVLGEPIAASRETFDKFYDREMPESVQLEAAFLAYGEDRIKTELLGTFSVLTDMISQVSTENYFLRSKIRPGGNNPIKGPFYALFMAVFDLVVRQEKSPDRIPEIFDALINTGDSLTSAAHYATTEDQEEKYQHD